MRQGNGKRARLALAITTGDLADNQHLNETRWFKQVLEGGTIDPYSGKPVLADECGNIPADVRARINADVAARQYTGVQDYDDYRDAPADRFGGFYDPDEAPAGGLYAAFPRYPGLMEAAQQPFTAAGIDVPWYISRGNHDGLVQGNAPASEDLFRAIAIGCLDVFPSAAFDPARFRGASDDELFASFGDPAFIQQLIAGGKTVAPDPDRRIVSKAEYRRIIGTSKRNGFGYTPRAELQRLARDRQLLRVHAQARIPVHLARHGRRGRRPERQHRRPAVPVAERRAEQGAAQRPAGRRLRPPRHPRRWSTPATTSRRASASRPTSRAATPIRAARRRSTAGSRAAQTIRSLLTGTPNVIAFVAGHTHSNEVEFFRGRRGRGFWQVVTASHVDWPQQSRLIEVMDNRDGTLSLFGTILDSAAPTAAPAPRPAIGMTVAELASLSRTLAYNDPQRAGLPESGQREDHRGDRADRNVELLIRDPR